MLMKMFNSFLLILTLIFNSAFAEKSFVCGKTKIDSRIIGGRVAERGVHPWQAQIVSSFVFYTFCGGALINERWILTAAHCTQSRTPEDINIFFGSVKLEKTNETQEIEVEKIIDHPNYKKNKYVDDISLIKLKKNVTFSQTVQPICLPEKTWQKFSNLVATGYGLTHRFGQPSMELMEVDLKQQDQERCVQMYRSLEYGKTHLCANKKGKDVCRGDSGGPLVTKKRGINYLVGLVSYGFVCGKFERPSVFTRVTEYLDWIQNTINE